VTKPDAFDAAAESERARIETRLGELIDALAAHHAGMREAIAYSLLGGGKRLRPLLCLWTHDAFDGENRDATLDVACAIECVHTYSLVHDDLPCMDDDDVRRGRPSAHRRFGEAVAVLAGDAMLTLAFQIVATLGDRHALAARLTVEVTATLAAAAGTGGLIGGQARDLAPPARDLPTVQRIHTEKTARLIAAAMEAGAILAGADDATRARIRGAGESAGVAFQIVDDLLDREGTVESLGKTPGKDVDEGKLTYPAVAGHDASRAEVARRLEAARAALPEAAGRPLGELIAFLGERVS
jgi:geranylgeranyl pyrophosphate synthase